jgi:hypothetical protein
MKDPKYLELPPQIIQLFTKRFHEYATALAMANAVSPNELPPQKPQMNGNKPQNGNGPEPLNKPQEMPT